MSPQLLTHGNTKTLKGQDQGWDTYILHLSPWTVSGVINVCRNASEGCRFSCLNTAGRGGMFKPGGTNSVQEARKRRTIMFAKNRDQFMELLVKDIEWAVRRTRRQGLKLAIRLNGTSDLPWERIRVRSRGDKTLMELFSDIQFYDYFKLLNRTAGTFENYHLTFSRSEVNELEARAAIQRGLNVAVVFDQLPETYMGLPVIDGDVNDLRFLDPQGVIVGLRAKGRAKKDTTGFVVRNVVDTVN